jgi:hypothetical protein
MSPATATLAAADPRVAGAGRDPARFRDAALRGSVTAAVTLLHNEVSPGVLPAGPAGHVLVPVTVEAACDRYQTPAGARRRVAPRSGSPPRNPLGAPDLVALRIPGAGPAAGSNGPDAWSIGLGWLRLGVAERLLAEVTAHLRDRDVGGTGMLQLPLVRAALADVAAGIAEARALCQEVPMSSTLRRLHRTLDEAGRRCLHLFGAAGFLVDGPGVEVRRSELLADVYAPPTEGGPL